jgi:ribonuclease D
VTAAPFADHPAGDAEEGGGHPAAPLLTLRDGLPPLVDTAAALHGAVSRLATGTGPVAVDAERASGYRYSGRAYLVQLRRQHVGTLLVDPIPFGDLGALGAAVGDAEWVLHAASQDLACLADVGLRPHRLFDTELAGRLLNYPKVGLATMVEDVLGFRLRKEHSAVDWSRRPFPESWLSYAALDVEVLVELRDILAEQLRSLGKLGWAEQEFTALAARTPPAPRLEPWRRTTGVHRIRSRRGLAVVRALWEARDQIARQRDIAPGRVLKDAAICEAANASPKDRAALTALPAFRGRGAERYLPRWVAAARQAQQLPDDELPALAARYEGPPPARSWPDRHPAAAARLALCREVMRELADVHAVPVENLLAPDTVRRLAWEPPAEVTTAQVEHRLRASGARDWQVQLSAVLLAAALRESSLASAGPGGLER